MNITRRAFLVFLTALGLVPKTPVGISAPTTPRDLRFSESKGSHHLRLLLTEFIDITVRIDGIDITNSVRSLSAPYDTQFLEDELGAIRGIVTRHLVVETLPDTSWEPAQYIDYPRPVRFEIDINRSSIPKYAYYYADAVLISLTTSTEVGVVMHSMVWKEITK